jgi:hypothetical protein
MYVCSQTFSLKSINEEGDRPYFNYQNEPKERYSCVGCSYPVAFQCRILPCRFTDISISWGEQAECVPVCVLILTSVHKRDTEMNKYHTSRDAMERDLNSDRFQFHFVPSLTESSRNVDARSWRLCEVGHGSRDDVRWQVMKIRQLRPWIPSTIIHKSYKKFWEELIPYFPWYDTGHIKNDASNNSSIVACVFFTTVTFLPCRCLATTGGLLPSRCLVTIGGFLPSSRLAAIRFFYRAVA